MAKQPLEMTLQEKMALLSFASKSLEILEENQLPPANAMDLNQWVALGTQAHIILARLDKDNPAMLPLPHDGVSWSKKPGWNT